MFVKDASANLREKDDTWNTTIGAFLGGGVLGLRCTYKSCESIGLGSET